ncbi:hypothetical protein NDU88_002426 [Pleurodeles waltl]|uniref:Uncharacterized protein n=1 Tax=Pleurodeles waltl TaxID=8319 RepID=A0AAV7T2I7_PLEWA|nr:hypothetical protein NDU88_002426 [Pleurodeles waltl]
MATIPGGLKVTAGLSESEEEQVGADGPPWNIEGPILISCDPSPSLLDASPGRTAQEWMEQILADLTALLPDECGCPRPRHRLRRRHSRAAPQDRPNGMPSPQQALVGQVEAL